MRSKNKNILHFFCYSPRVYSGFDRFNIKLSVLLNEEGYQSVFVFSDSIDLPELIHDINAAGIKTELLSTKSKYTLTIGVFKLFLKYKPSIAHSHFDNYIQLITALFSWVFFTRFFTTFHSTISFLTTNQYKIQKGYAKLYILRFFYRFLLGSSKNVFCVSKAVEEQFRRYSSSKSKKIKCLHLGVDMNKKDQVKEDIRQKMNLPKDEILICNLSAIEPIKGIDILIEAVSILKMKYKINSFKIFHIGGLRSEIQQNTDYKLDLAKKVKELNLEEFFIWMGPRNDINELLRAFDIYVHPSRMEGIGMALMEAASFSLPLIGSYVGGIPEVVHHEVNGFLHKPDDAIELADYMKLLIENHELRLSMGSASNRIANEFFNAAKQSELLKEYYIL